MDIRVLATASWLAALALVAAAVLLPRGDYLAEGPPTFDALDLAVLGLLSIAAVLVVAPLFTVLDQSRIEPPSAFEARTIIFVLLLGLAGPIVLAISPPTFTDLLREDSLTEWVSAVAILLGAIVLLIGAAVFRPTRGMPSLARLAALVLFGLIVLVIGLEEVSWFQRELGYATPDWLLELNWQGEVNFHNVDTNRYENLYYGGAALLLVGARVLSYLGEGPFNNWLRRFAPSHIAFALGVIACASNWDMWRVVGMQAGFALAIAMTIAEVARALRQKHAPSARLFAGLAVTAFAVQLAYLVLGPTIYRSWDVSEAKELFIGLGLGVYCLDQVLSLRRERRAPQTLPLAATPGA